jgi:hypothetical protein
MEGSTVKFLMSVSMLRALVPWLVVVGASLASLPGLSQTAIDPLQLLDPSVGRLMWRAVLGYSASGHEGVGFDESGDPYGYVVLGQQLAFSFSASTGLSGRTSMGAMATLQRIDTTESRHYADLQTQDSSTGRDVSCLVWHQSRLDPAEETDPRLTISAGHPAVAGLSLSAAILKDPMVLTVEAGFRGFKTRPAAWLVLDLGAGFVANSWIRVTAFAGLEVPVDGPGLPAARVGGEVRYVLDAVAGRDVGVRAALVLHGERTSLLFELELSGG